MPDGRKITELNEETNVTDAHYFPVSDGNETKKVSFGTLNGAWAGALDYGEINARIDADVESDVNAWLVAHPEATTTVQNGAVTTDKLADGAVTTAKLADGAVTDAKLAQTGGVYSDIGGVVSLLNCEVANGAFSFESGYINTTTGENQTIGTPTLRTAGYIRLTGKYVTFSNIPTGFKILVHKYNEDKGYMGYIGWFNANSPSSYVTNRDLSDVSFIRIAAVENTDGPITPSDMAGLSVTMKAKIQSEISGISTKLEEYTSVVSNQLDSYNSTWHASAGQSHSSATNLVDVSISAGETFYASVNTSDRETLTGALVARDSSGATIYDIGSIQTNTILKFVATSAFAKVGIYLPEVSNDCTVYLNIIKGNSLYKVNVENEVPSYWTDNLDSVIQKVSDLQTYESGVTFGFITDIHWETNHQVSPKLVDYIAHNSRVDMWLNGGDSASGDSGDGTQQMEWLYECIGKYGNGYKFYSLNGNHDTNGIGGGTVLSSAEIKNLIMPYYNDVTFGSGNYYWFDYRGTRFVCLDTGGVGASDSAQIAWAENVIRQSTIPVIVAMHIVKVAYSDTTPCAFFNDLIAAIGTNTDGKVKMIVCGHTHHDFTMTASNGIPVVALTTDSRFADDGITRVKGTTTEQCLSIVTIDYVNKTINVTRVGTIGDDMSLTY